MCTELEANLADSFDGADLQRSPQLLSVVPLQGSLGSRGGCSLEGFTRENALREFLLSFVETGASPAVQTVNLDTEEDGSAALCLEDELKLTEGSSR